MIAYSMSCFRGAHKEREQVHNLMTYALADFKQLYTTTADAQKVPLYANFTV